MAYTAPTVSELKAAYPIFNDVDNAVIESALDEAALKVDDSWLSQADFTIGRMLWAAHVLTMNGQGTSPEVQFAGIKKLSIASLSIERATIEGEKGLGDIASTSFGRRFQSLARANVPHILVA